MQMTDQTIVVIGCLMQSHRSRLHMRLKSRVGELLKSTLRCARLFAFSLAGALHVRLRYCHALSCPLLAYFCLRCLLPLHLSVTSCSPCYSNQTSECTSLYPSTEARALSFLPASQRCHTQKMSVRFSRQDSTLTTSRGSIRLHPSDNAWDSSPSSV